MKKIPKLQIFRAFVQIVFLFLLPGLFTLTFSQLGQIYSMIINGKFNFLQAFPNLAAVLTIFVLTIVLSRFFCGWFCAFGTFNDYIYIISKKIFRTKFKVDKDIDAILKYLKYVVLLFIVIFIWTIGSKTFGTFSPWDAFAQITNLPQVISNYPIGFIALILIALGAIFIERFFCRYLCPLGAVFSIISRISIFKINKPSDKCGKCRVCTNNCSMGIELYKVQKVRGGECINCLKCIEKCPRSNTRATICDENINPALASSIAIAAFAGVYSANNMAGTIMSKNFPVAISANASNSSAQQIKYKDGTYTGTGTGFSGGTTKISVTVKGGKIDSIETISEEDTSDYYQRAYNSIQDEIISSQSAQVDAVSGATYSSHGIISAVQDALSKAVASNSPNSNTTVPTSNTASTQNSDDTTNNNAPSSGSTTASVAPSTSSTTTTQGKYKDGTYTGTGTGFRDGTTKISVTVKGGKIGSIETISEEDSPNFYQRTYSSIQNEIISSQSAQVDAVSGATYSSRGIMTAVEDVLNQAKA